MKFNIGDILKLKEKKYINWEFRCVGFNPISNRVILITENDSIVSFKENELELVKSSIIKKSINIEYGQKVLINRFFDNTEFSSVEYSFAGFFEKNNNIVYIVVGKTGYIYTANNVKIIE